jgi:hypothetical protein
MRCCQCHHENRPEAGFCEKCGHRLLSLWPQADLRSRPDPARVRLRRRHRKLIDIAAAVGVVVAGLFLIARIVIASPGWQRIIASWRESLAVRSASVPRLLETAVAPMSAPAVNGDALRGELPMSPPAAVPGVISDTNASQSPTRSARVPPLPSVDLPPSQLQSDSAQVMASLLVSQLGQEPAWRTALANADAQPTDSAEQAFWRAVAAVIRDGSAQRLRRQ